jgi:hypothetical protein
MLHILSPGRQADLTTDILAEGARELQKKGMKRFAKRYKAWVRDSMPYEFDIGADIHEDDMDCSDDEE